MLGFGGVTFHSIYGNAPDFSRRLSPKVPFIVTSQEMQDLFLGQRCES